MPMSDVTHIDWVDVPAGLLVRGTALEDVDTVAMAHADIGVQRAWILKEAPRSEIHVSTFAMSRTPVTVAQWAAFVEDVGLTWLRAGRAAEDHPIDGVTWTDASRFCEWFAAKAELRVRLPTEVEWERAARGDDAREYPWGHRYESGRGNLADLGIGTTTPVGSFPGGASYFGLLDMAGNVDEWTSSPYAPYFGAPSEVPALEHWAIDPHVTRGGGFLHDRDLARCARRHGVYPPTRGAGFRLVQSSTNGFCGPQTS
jgi:formylglycine-generating enzyme required for sulfatase activity